MRGLLAPLLGIVLAACGSPTRYAPCTSDADCAGALECLGVTHEHPLAEPTSDTAIEVLDQCSQRCETERDCPRSAYCAGRDPCTDGVCSVPYCP